MALDSARTPTLFAGLLVSGLRSSASLFSGLAAGGFVSGLQDETRKRAGGPPAGRLLAHVPFVGLAMGGRSASLATARDHWSPAVVERTSSRLVLAMAGGRWSAGCGLLMYLPMEVRTPCSQAADLGEGYTAEEAAGSLFAHCQISAWDLDWGDGN